MLKKKKKFYIIYHVCINYGCRGYNMIIFMYIEFIGKLYLKSDKM